MSRQLQNSKAKLERVAIVGTLVRTMLGFRGELIQDLVAAGHSVYAFATDYTAETEQKIRAMGATPVAFRMGQLSTNPLSDLRSMLQLRRLFRQHSITLSYCCFAKPAIYGTLAAKLAGVPKRIAKIEGLGRVFTVDPQGDKLSKRLLRLIMATLFRFSLPHAHKVLVLNHGDKHDLQRFGKRIPEPVVLGGIGVCLKQYSLCPPVTTPVRFIFLGRLLAEKGVRYFVDAAKAIKRSHPQVEFLLIGAPDEGRGSVNNAELEHLVHDDIVIWPGIVTDVVPWLAKSSVFVLPSYYREGVPRSTQEALAMGRPVITTDMPGCRKTVRAGENGFLVPPHDQTALEQAMLRFIQEPELIPIMGAASYQLACQDFNVRQINQTIMQEIGLAPKLPAAAPATAQTGTQPAAANDWQHAQIIAK